MSSTVPGTSPVENSPITSGRYLTDGERLYRNLGSVDGSHELVGLEDCSSLDVLLACSAELRDGALQVVEPIPADETVVTGSNTEYC
jgi:hypothetical protein